MRAHTAYPTLHTGPTISSPLQTLFRISLPSLLPFAFALACAPAQAQSRSAEAFASLPDAPTAPIASAPFAPIDPQTTPPPAPTQTDSQRAADQVQKQEKQRVFGVVPNFNIAYSSDVPPLSKSQKLHLAFRSAIDPFQFVAAGLDAAYSQATDAFGPEFNTKTDSTGHKYIVREEGYGQGVQGYAKRFGASYADNFDGTIIGNALLPILLKEDPRYFRKGTGTIKRRLLYSVSTTVWCKRDNGNWGPNYANVVGNLAAGGISNIYYPSSDRGASLTITRGLTVTAEGAFGAVANEFLPDLTRHFLHREVSGKRIDTPQPTPGPAPGVSPDAPK